MTMTLRTVEFDSALMGRTVSMNVVAPEDDGKSYPVVYFHHGLGDTFEAAAERCEVERLASERDLIVVMPDAGESWYCNDPREGGLPWEDHLAIEVVDFIDTNFPTIQGPSGRGQTGFSMGGYGAMVLAMLHPDRFGAVASRAGSFAFGHELRPDRPERSAFMQAVAPPAGRYDLFVLSEKLAREGTELAIRFDVGLHDHLLDANRRFHTHLEEIGLAHEYEEKEGFHRWAWVNEHLAETLDYLKANLSEKS